MLGIYKVLTYTEISRCTTQYIYRTCIQRSRSRYKCKAYAQHIILTTQHTQHPYRNLAENVLTGHTRRPCIQSIHTYTQVPVLASHKPQTAGPRRRPAEPHVSARAQHPRRRDGHPTFPGEIMGRIPAFSTLVLPSLAWPEMEILGVALLLVLRGA